MIAKPARPLFVLLTLAALLWGVPAEDVQAVPLTPAGTRLETSEKELDDARKQILAPIPDARADYVFGADQALPAWEGMAGMRTVKNYFGNGADGVVLDAMQECVGPGFFRPSAVYWKLTDIQPGRYYLGLWLDTQDAALPTEYSMMRLLTSMFLNGWPVRFTTTTDPVQVKPGVWLAELQTGVPVELKPGDEIAVRSINAQPPILRLGLYRNPPPRGHGVTGQTFGMLGSRYFARLRLGLHAEFEGSGEAGTPHQARIKVVNPLPYAADADVEWTLADHYGAPVTARTERVQLAPHATFVTGCAFTASGDAQAYQLDVKTRPAPDFQPPVKRPLEMIELNDWSSLEFLPNVRGPLEDWMHARLDLRTDNAGGRMSLRLNGDDWERAPLDGRRIPPAPPAALKYERFRIPGGGALPKDVFGMWYRKTFRVPAWMRGATFQLQVDNAACEGTLFLNGQRVGSPCRELCPNVVEVTRLLKQKGDNELVILVRDGVALVMASFIDQYNPDNALENSAKHDAAGSARHVAILGSVWLRTMPAVRVRQTLVLPDVEKGALQVLTRVENTRGETHTVELRYAAFQQGRPTVAAIPAQRVTLKPHETAEVRTRGNGKGLEPYTPARPVLAGLVTTLIENDVPVDVQAQRFGYRSIKVKGKDLTLNGRPLFLFGSGPIAGTQEYLERENGMEISRGLNVDYSFADEIGRLHYVSFGGEGLSWENINNETYWAAERDLSLELVWNHGSHPCVVGWDLSNENYWYSVYYVGLDGQSKCGARYFSLAEAVRSAIWPDYWFMSDGNGNLGGRLNFTSWHYLNHGWSHGYGASPRGFGDLKDGVSQYPPDCFFVDGAASPPRPDTVVGGPSGGADNWRPGMACADTEEFWFVGDRNGPAISKFVGDRAAISPAWQYWTGRGMWWGKLSLEGYRDMEQTAILSIYPHNFLNLVTQDITFSLPQQAIRYYSGARFEKRLNIHDDEFLPGKLEFAWRLVALDGTTAISGKTQNMKSTTSYLKRSGIAFAVPKVTERTRFTLDMTLRKNGKLREHEQRIVEVWPAFQAVAAPAGRGETAPTGGGYNRATTVALFDPSGTVAPILARFGATAKPIKALTAEALAGGGVLVVGPDCVMAKMGGEQQIVREFAASGGRVLVLPQQEAALLPVDTYLEKRGYATMGFVRTQGHPVTRGLTDADFAMWNPEHLISRGLYRTPNRGNFLALVDCGHETLTWTPLLEVYVGQGSILATQLPLLTALDTEPMAAEMWRRLLGYLAQPPYRRIEAKLTVWSGASEPLLARLKELRADVEIVKAVDGQKPVTLVEMNQPDFSAQSEAFRQYVQQGATLLLHRVRPEHKAWLATLIGRTVSVEIQPYRAWVDRQMLEQRDGLAEGLNNVDFYWRPNVGGEGPDSQHQVSAEPAEGKGQVEYLVKVEGAKDCLFPGAWMEIPVGRGRVVIDQVKWELPEKEKNDYGSPMRVASMLLSNLGVVQKPPLPRPALPKDITYAPIDLTAVVNRGVRDDVSGDDVGWTDWGPGQDLRDFPLGDIRLHGIPYHVTGGASNAIVLRCGKDFVKSLADYPGTVTIPVGQGNVAGLYFLHTGGWTFGVTPFAYRIIRYADGTEERIGLTEYNTCDWNYGRDEFPDEETTLSTVAWKGTCKMNPVTRVYQTLWANPHPEKEIKEVVLTVADLADKQYRFLAHLGLTAVIRAPEAAPAAATRDPRKAQALLNEALALALGKGNKPKEAAAKLEEALKADNRNVGAWKELTTLRARTDSVEAFTALCRTWFQAMPENYEAHNTLGQFLENHGQPEAALTEYKKSLEIEWNQPPTIEAAKRLEKRVK
jgi:hypothetical protein